MRFAWCLLSYLTAWARLYVSGLACAQATQAWKVHVGQGLMNSPAAVREIWLASLTPIEPTADPQALAVARMERLTRLRAEASAADESEAFAGLEVV